MKTLRTLLLIACLAAASGCRNHPEETPVPPADDGAESAFTEGLRLYEAGHYSLAEKRFLAPAIWSAGPQVQLKTLKYLAFSYCVTQRPIQCRFAFDRALQIDPSFHLGTAEASHPLWGPVFVQAASR